MNRMVGKQWPTPGLQPTPVTDSLQVRAQALRKVSELEASVGVRLGQWSDLKGRIQKALAVGDATPSLQLQALAAEAHTRLAKGW